MSFVLPVVEAGVALGVTKIATDLVTCDHCNRRHRKGSKAQKEHTKASRLEKGRLDS